MNDHEVRQTEMFVRIRDLLRARPEAFPADELGGKWLAKFLDSVQDVESFAAEQISGKNTVRKGSVTKDVAHQALLKTLELVRLTAIAVGKETSGLENKFRMPKSRSITATLNAARAFVADAEPIAPLFIEHKMPPDFIEQLKSDIDHLQQAMTEANAGKRNKTAARIGLQKAVKKAFTALHHLDAVVANMFRNDDRITGVWESARRVERAWKSKKSKAANGSGASEAVAPEGAPETVKTQAEPSTIATAQASA
jgi:hypothetical protein